MGRTKHHSTGKEIFNYTVEIQRYCTHSEREDAEFGSWSESFDNSFKSIKKTKKTYADVYSPIDLDSKSGFLVWAEYSHGDSFGRSERGNVEVIALFEKKESAVKLQKLIKKWDNDYRKKENNQYSYEVEIEGQKLTIYCPWHGFFESLDDVHIQAV